MDVKVTEHVVRIAVVSPQGRVDAYSTPALRQQFEQLLDAGVTRYVIDLSDVPFLDSAGLAALVSLLKRARQAGGDVKLVWPEQEGAQRILRLTKFDRVFGMAETADAAVEFC